MIIVHLKIIMLQNMLGVVQTTQTPVMIAQFCTQSHVLTPCLHLLHMVWFRLPVIRVFFVSHFLFTMTPTYAT